MNSTRDYLQGKKTYIVVGMAILYVLGAKFGLWTYDEKILSAFGAAGFGTLAAKLQRLLSADSSSEQPDPAPQIETKPPQAAGSMRIALLCALGGLFGMLLILSACTSSKLAPGAAYTAASTNSLGEVTYANEYPLFVADKAFELAYRTLDTAFQIEHDNRQLFWQISPDIKHGLDAARKEATRVKLEWAQARQRYLALPTPENLKSLNGVLQEMQRVAASTGPILSNAAQPKKVSP